MTLEVKITKKKLTEISASKEKIDVNICGALRHLVPFVQVKKREKHPWRSVTFRNIYFSSYYIFQKNTILYVICYMHVVLNYPDDCNLFSYGQRKKPTCGCL